MWWMLGALLVSGCAGLRELVPRGPVHGWEEDAALRVPFRAATVTYTGPARSELPVPPLQVWGITYALDLVFRTRHPAWDMHEYSSILTPDGPLWLMKDARACDRSQSIVADVSDIGGWLPEVPIRRKAWPVEVVDRSDEGKIDLELAYENTMGEPVEVRYTGGWPRARKKRNASTMGHSADVVLAVLDLSAARSGRGEITIAGVPQRPRRVLGLIPFVAAIAQTQGGFSSGVWTVEPVREDGVLTAVRTVHLPGGEQSWSLVRGPGFTELVQHDALRTARYRFLGAGETLELVEASVQQVGQAGTAVTVRFDPALPDARRPFEGSGESRWLLDVGGQRAHATGTVQVTPTPDGVAVTLAADAPDWAASRPMAWDVGFVGEIARVEGRMVAPPPPCEDP